MKIKQSVFQSKEKLSQQEVSENPCDEAAIPQKPTRKKPVCLALQERVLVIDMHNQGMLAHKIAKELGCGATQVRVSYFSFGKHTYEVFQIMCK